MCRAVWPRESRVVLRSSACVVRGGGNEERMDCRRSVLLRRQASRISSRGEAP